MNDTGDELQDELQEAGAKDEGEGSSIPKTTKIIRDAATGQFLPGSINREIVPKGGYKQQQQKILRQSLPPERLVKELESLYDDARRKGYMRLALQVISLWAAYSVGKPTEKVEVTTDSATVLSQWLAGRQPMTAVDVEADADADVIDVDPLDQSNL